MNIKEILLCKARGIDVMNIEEILLCKARGIDCTEEESGYMKGLLKEIMERFPCEFSEAIEEQDNPELKMNFDLSPRVAG